MSRNNRQQEQVEVECDQILEERATLHALPCTIGGELHWVPKSQIHSWDATANPPTISLTPFIAKKLGVY